VSDNQRFSRLSDTYSAKSQPNSENSEIRPETAVGNQAFSTKTCNRSDNQRFIRLSDVNSAKNQLQFLSLDYMAVPDIPYTIPKLVKGKRVTTVPKGSTWAKEEAKQNWYVEFFFHNAETYKMERFRPTKNLNRLKDPKEKLKQFTRLCDAYKIALEGGWSPIDEKANDRLKRQISSLTLEAAKDLFEEYHIAKGTRKKSRQSYLSKINQFVAYYGPDKRVSEISDYEITEFLNFMERKREWTGVTYNSSRIILNNYFRYLKINKYIAENPVTDIETRTKIPTESHQVFSDKDFKAIMKWLNEHDQYCLFFVKMIYYTCIRPKELRYLQLKHINLAQRVITVPASISKNKKSLPVSIDESLSRELKALKLSSHEETDYLLGSTETIISEKRIGENTPYNRF